ncbi:MAG: tetratricopeptide repeat protein [Aestuariivirga sp.]|nr:tetratricopeptide repeat protein [Aestuariivirga sp.]
MSDYYDLGPYTRPVTTTSKEAQAWFDRGLIWCYGYNHDEAVRCFKKAAKHDPNCAMAHWGIAYAAGPNYNKQWVAFDPVDLKSSLSLACSATKQALKLLDQASPVEQALIRPLAKRYQLNEPGNVTPIWNDDYAAAMREVYLAHKYDLDVTALFAEAIMNRTPWQLWDIKSGKPAEGADTAEAIAVLERAMATPNGMRHPGILHMYLHLMEMSPHPERALRAGDALCSLIPDAGHLVHMPTHIDVLCGNYKEVIDRNGHATIADQKYLAREGAVNFYSLYRCHNYHFKTYGAMFLGQFGPALEAAEDMAAAISEDLLRVESPPMADWLEAFVSIKLHVYIRFGKWQEIISAPLPTDQKLYCVTTAMLHYAKAVAYAASFNVPAAEKEARLFEEALARIPESRCLFNNTSLDILAVAAEMMKGEIEYRKFNFEKAFAHLRKSVELYDTMRYDEPWGFMQPTRHALGALLLEQNRVEEAEAIYRADLGLDGTLARACQHPDNIWSLHGFHECLMRLGKHAEATFIKQRLDLATARADVPVKSSCFCRMTAA